MKTPKELNKIYARLPKEEINLSTHKVSLGVMQDIDKSLGKLDPIIKGADSINSQMEQKGKVLEKTITQINALFGKANKTLEAGYKVTDAGSDLLKKADAAAKELGVAPEDIKGYSEFEKKRKDAFFAVKSIEDAYYDYINGVVDKLEKF